MTLGQYLAGAAQLIFTLGCAVTAAALVVRARFAYLPRPAAWVAWGLLSAMALLAIEVVPLGFGVLARGTVLVTAALVLAGAWAWSRGGPTDAREPSRGLPGTRWAWIAAAAAVAVPLAYLAAFTRSAAVRPIDFIDATAFHFPQIGRWIQSGSLWQNDNLVPGWAFGNYPNSGDVLHMALVLPFHNDAFVRFGGYPMLVLAGAAVYAAVTELGGPRPLGAVLGAMVPATVTFAVITIDLGLVDVYTLAGFACGLLFLLRHARTGRGGDLALAGLGWGLALGSKWYGVSCVIAGGLVWAAARLLSRRPWRQVAGDVVRLAAWVFASGGIWLVRNLVETGNPVFPQKVTALGVTLFDAPPDPLREAGGLTIAHYLTDWDVWRRDLGPGLFDSFGWAGVALALGALVALFAGVLAWRRGTSGWGRGLAVSAGFILLVVVYVNTPYSAFGPEGHPFPQAAARYAGPAIVAAAVTCGWAGARLSRTALTAACAAGLALLVQGILTYDRYYALLYVSNPPTFTRTVLTGAVAIAGLGAAILGASWAVRNRRVVPLGIDAAAAVAGAVAWGERNQRTFNDYRYRGVNAAYDTLLARAGSGHRIGLSGPQPVMPASSAWIAFGPRISNTVEYVGPWVRERLERYRSAEPYRAALRRGRYDYLLIAIRERPGPLAPEVAWTEQEGWRLAADGGVYRLYAPPPRATGS